jgi:lysophospholipase L1-like esterase
MAPGWQCLGGGAQPSYLDTLLRRQQGNRITEKLVVVAFGDSLTTGYISPTQDDEWPSPVPYTRFLTRKAEALLRSEKSDLRVEVLNRGVVGELTEEMARRFDRDVVWLGPDVVVVLGGSNDLGWEMEPGAIAENLTAMYDQALAQGIRPVACTVPSVLGFDGGIEPRLRLNAAIKRISADRAIACVDLFSATADADGRLRGEYSNDGLHLSPAGYEAMADAIFASALSQILLQRMSRA